VNVRPQTILVGVLALVFGGSAAVGVNSMMKGRGAKAKVAVVVAALDLARGATITADMVTTREYAEGSVPADALAKLEDAINRAVAIPMIKGEPVLDPKLSPKGAGRGLAALVPKGMRAVTIQTPNVASGVAGFVMPGNKVDVLLTVADAGGGADPAGGGSTTTLLQRVEIMAVDQRIDAPADNKVDTKELRSVTLLVTPHQANLLDLGQNRGTLHLALRNPDDDRDSGSQPVTLADLRYRREKPWDERLKSVLEAMAKTRAPGQAPTATSRPAHVRTLRGRHEGVVRVQGGGASSVGLLGGGPSVD
jgi:pilus assembly protein CpaB